MARGHRRISDYLSQRSARKGVECKPWNAQSSYVEKADRVFLPNGNLDYLNEIANTIFNSKSLSHRNEPDCRNAGKQGATFGVDQSGAYWALPLAVSAPVRTGATRD
jgi:hypothetical protein